MHLEQNRKRLQWRHNERDGVLNHHPHDCLPNRLFRRRSKKTSKLRVTGLCEGNSPVTGEFPAQRTSNADDVSIWLCHHQGVSHISEPTNSASSKSVLSIHLLRAIRCYKRQCYNETWLWYECRWSKWVHRKDRLFTSKITRKNRYEHCTFDFVLIPGFRVIIRHKIQTCGLFCYMNLS